MQPEAGQVTRTVMVEALLAESAGRDIAAVIEDGKGVAMLEDAGPLVRPASGGDHLLSGSSTPTTPSMTQRLPSTAPRNDSHIVALGDHCQGSLCATLP